MAQSRLLMHTVSALAESSIDYMLTGSLVSSMQGEPRATHTLDFVVWASPDSIDAFLARFPAGDYYFDIEAVHDAVGQGGMFNILAASGDKVDIWMLTDSAFDQARFARRQTVELFGQLVYVSSPEDTVLMKLLWAEQSGGSQKQLFDAAKVFDLQREYLDFGYFDSWIARLGLADQLAAMQAYL